MEISSNPPEASSASSPNSNNNDSDDEGDSVRVGGKGRQRLDGYGPPAEVQTSSLLDGTVDVGGADPPTPFEEAHRGEIVRLFLQTLQYFGYGNSMRTLERESGYKLQGPHIGSFRSAILHGEWEAAIGLLSSLCVGAEELPTMRFLIFRQKYLELLEAGLRMPAVECLRQQLTPNCPVSAEASVLHKLTALIMCKETQAIYKRMNWDGKLGRSRSQLLSELLTHIDKGQLLSEHRLAALLQQAQAHQRHVCRFHNVDVTDFSLLGDHVCTKTTLPKYTRFILKCHSDEVWFVAFSHNGRFLATASKDRSCCVFDTARWRENEKKVNVENAHEGPSSSSNLELATTPLFILQGHSDAVSFVSWSPDDSLLASCANDCTIQIWSMKTGTSVLKFTRHTEPISALGWFPDGRHVASVAQDKLLLKWDVVTGAVKAKHVGARGNDLAISRDGAWMVTIDSDKRIILYNLRHKLGGSTSSPSMSPDRELAMGSMLEQLHEEDDEEAEEEEDATSGSDDGEEEDEETEEQDLEEQEEGGGGEALDGLLLGGGGGGASFGSSIEGKATSVYKTIHKSPDSLTSVSLSEDGNFILVNKAVHEKRGCIHLYDLRCRPFKIVQRFTGHMQRRFVIRSCFGGVNQAFVLSGSEDHTCVIYNRESGKRLATLKGHSNVVNSVAWNPVVHDLVASASDDGTVRIWMATPPPPQHQSATLSSSLHLSTRSAEGGSALAPAPAEAAEANELEVW